LSSGIGRSFFVLYSSSESLIDFSCAILFVSLVHAKYQENDTNHTVANIASIVITTISSTSVNAEKTFNHLSGTFLFRAPDKGLGFFIFPFFIIIFRIY